MIPAKFWLNISHSFLEKKLKIWKSSQAKRGKTICQSCRSQTINYLNASLGKLEKQYLLHKVVLSIQKLISTYYRQIITWVNTLSERKERNYKSHIYTHIYFPFEMIYIHTCFSHEQNAIFSYKKMCYINRNDNIEIFTRSNPRIPTYLQFFKHTISYD